MTSTKETTPMRHLLLTAMMATVLLLAAGCAIAPVAEFRDGIRTAADQQGIDLPSAERGSDTMDSDTMDSEEADAPDDAAESATEAPADGPAQTIANADNLKIYLAPRVESAVVGTLYEGDTNLITGWNSDRTWVRIEVPASARGEGWVTARSVSLNGDITNVPTTDEAVTEIERPAPAAGGAVINTDGTRLRVRSTPSASGDVVGYVYDREEYAVLALNDAETWAQLDLPNLEFDTAEGWVSVEFLTLGSDLTGEEAVATTDADAETDAESDDDAAMDDSAMDDAAMDDTAMDDTAMDDTAMDNADNADEVDADESGADESDADEADTDAADSDAADSDDETADETNADETDADEADAIIDDADEADADEADVDEIETDAADADEGDEANADEEDADELDLSQYPVPGPDEAVVVTDGSRLRVRAQATVDSAIIGYAFDGEVYTIIDTSNDGEWLQIELEDGQQGWIVDVFTLTADGLEEQE